MGLKNNKWSYRRNTISHWVKSAIIGHWRNGAKPEQIGESVNLPIQQVKKIITNYFKSNLL